MKIFIHVIALAALGVAFAAQAHDPKEHMKDTQKPDCAAMKNMDHGKMDGDDPVMQAMMKRCRKAMHDDETDQEAAKTEHQTQQNSSDDSDHQH